MVILISVIVILGFAMDIKIHLEADFTPSMSWENYGSYWEIDHIVPLSHFDEKDPNSVRDAWHFSNLQPLEKSLNRSKQHYNTKTRLEIKMSIMEKYVADSEKTLAMDYDMISKRLCEPRAIRLLHAAMGLTTEANEIVDHMKKVIFYGKPLDETNLVEEMGDLLFYMSIICREFGITMEEIAEKNIAKLKARYGDKFTESAAINRDLTTERKILEG